MKFFGDPFLPRREFTVVKKVLDDFSCVYRSLLRDVVGSKLWLEQFTQPTAGAYFFDNGFFPILDAIAMYAVFRARRPQRFVEIGSGWSTLWARECSNFLGLDLKITCIDPEPRRSIHEVVNDYRQAKAQDIPVGWYLNELQPNGMLSIDTSHYLNQDTELPYLFCELMPSLMKGTWVHIHDIFLPWDYPANWADRAYTEQYPIATLLLGGKTWGPTLPVHYVQMVPEVNYVIDELWEGTLGGVPREGGGFWMEKLR